MAMKLCVVSVYDRAAQAFTRPFFVNSEGQAIRSFTDEVNRVAPENEMNRHPNDFDLFFVGTFDDQTGLFVCEESPRRLLRGSEAVIK